MARLSFRCDQELVDLVDAARGGVPRETWLRSIVSQVVEMGSVTRDSIDEVNAVPVRRAAEQALGGGDRDRAPAPAEQSGVDRAAMFRRATQKR